MTDKITRSDALKLGTSEVVTAAVTPFLSPELTPVAEAVEERREPALTASTAGLDQSSDI